MLEVDSGDNTVDTTDNNPHSLTLTDASPTVDGQENPNSTLENLLTLDTENISDGDSPKTKRVCFDIPLETTSRHSNIPVRANYSPKSRKRCRIPEYEPLNDVKKFKGNLHTSTDFDLSDKTTPPANKAGGKSRFYRFEYKPGKRSWHKESKPNNFSPEQVPEKKVGFMDSLSDEKKKLWYQARALNTNSDRQAYRFSWLDQALSSGTNTYWGFGTMGLPPWAIGNEKMVYDIFQVRSNASREVMEIVREHLRADSTDQYARSTKIINDLEKGFDEDQLTESRAAMDIHSTRNLNLLSESLSKRREWLVENQPTEVEAITMCPEKRKLTKPKTPEELLSDDDQYHDDGLDHTPKKDVGGSANPRKRKRPSLGGKMANQPNAHEDKNDGGNNWSVATKRRRRRRPNSRSNSHTDTSLVNDQHWEVKDDGQTDHNQQNTRGHYNNRRSRPGNRTRGRRPFQRGQRGSHSNLSMESANWNRSELPGPGRVRGHQDMPRRQTHRV